MLLALNGEIAPAPTVGVLQRGVLRRPVELTGVKRTPRDHRKSVATDPTRSRSVHRSNRRHCYLDGMSIKCLLAFS